MPAEYGGQVLVSTFSNRGITSQQRLSFQLNDHTIILGQLTSMMRGMQRPKI
jgi:hypothetical protein